MNMAIPPPTAFVEIDRKDDKIEGKCIITKTKRGWRTKGAYQGGSSKFFTVVTTEAKFEWFESPQSTSADSNYKSLFLLLWHISCPFLWSNWFKRFERYIEACSVAIEALFMKLSFKRYSNHHIRQELNGFFVNDAVTCQRTTLVYNKTNCVE